MYSNSGNPFITVVVIWGLIALFVFFVGGFCWDYSVNTWLVYLGKAPALKFWQAGLIALIPGVGQLSFPVAPLTFIAMLFL